MSAAALPAYLTISQLAVVLGLARRTVAYRVAKGVIPSTKLGNGRTSHRVIFLSALKRDFPELFEAVLLKTEVMAFTESDDE